MLQLIETTLPGCNFIQKEAVQPVWRFCVDFWPPNWNMLMTTGSIFIIAEGGVNHNGNPNLAYQLIDAAAEAGVDAVKIQTFRAERLVTRSAPKAAYQIQFTDPKESQLEMLSKLEISRSTFRELKEYSEQLKLGDFSKLKDLPVYISGGKNDHKMNTENFNH